MKFPYRVGIGYDIHRFSQHRKLILGGIPIKHDRGLAGHSDADVVLHALADAIFGAAGLEDIGNYFPNTDPEIKDIDSRIILKTAYEEAKKLGYEVGNVDCVIIAEEPRIFNQVSKMKEAISGILNLETSAIGIKATTNEKIGEMGRGAGIAAQAICTLYFP